MNEIHPARMYWKTKDSLSPILDGFEETRRQEIPTAFFRNGSIYIIRIKPFLKNHKVMIKPSIGYVMPSSQLLNIDEPRDIIMAEALMLAWKKGII
jgi:CMP-N-acetylneuraminic acid synthetase